MMGNIANYLNNYRKTECPSITSEGMLFSRFGIDMVLFDEILAKTVVRVSQVWTDSPGDLQIDGLCILLDGELVADVDEAKSLIMMKGGMEQINRVELYFIQSKSKKSFSVSEFNHFSSGVQNFVTNRTVPAKVNAKIENWFSIWKVIEKEIRRTNSQPEVIANMFIVFNGDSLNNDSLVDQMKNFQQNLPRCSSVTQVKYKDIGANKLIKIYKRRIAANQNQRFHVSRPENHPLVHEKGKTQTDSRRPFENHHTTNDYGSNGQERSPSRPHVVQRSNSQQYKFCTPISEVKNAIRQCNQDPNGYVFLADLGAVANVNGSLKFYLSKFPQHFQFDNNRHPSKVKIVGELYNSSVTIRPMQLDDSSVEKRNELRKIISGRVITVDTADWSGTIEASGYGSIPFCFSDLVNPEQETELTPGSFVRFEVTTWRNMTKVKSNTLTVI